MKHMEYKIRLDDYLVEELRKISRNMGIPLAKVANFLLFSSIERMKEFEYHKNLSPEEIPAEVELFILEKV